MSDSVWLHRLAPALFLLWSAHVLPPHATPGVQLGPVRWSWLAPEAHVTRPAWTWSRPGEEAWRSGVSELLVRRDPEGFHWELRAEAGAALPLRFRYEGVGAAFTRTDTTLVLSTGPGLLTERGLMAWQPRPDGSRRSLGARYEGVTQRAGAVDYSIALDDVDAELPVVIDPEVSLSLITSRGDDTVVALDVAGDTYVAVHGATEETVFQVRGAVLVQKWTAPPGATIVDLAHDQQDLVVLGNTSQPILGELDLGGGGQDLFLARLKLSDLGAGPVVRLGSSLGDRAESLDVRWMDGSGNPLPRGAMSIAVAGTTHGTFSFPGSSTWGSMGGANGFVITAPAEFGAWPQAVQTFLVGGGDDEGFSLVAWSGDQVVAAGATTSTDLDTLGQVVQPVPAGGSDVMLAGLDPRQGLSWLTFFGGKGDEVPTGLVGIDQKYLVLTGTTTGEVPLHRPWSAWTRPGGADTFIATFSGQAQELITNSRWPMKDRLGAKPMAGLMIGLAGTSSADDLPLLGASQPQRGGGSDATFTVWDILTGRPVSSTWLGGKGLEGGVVQRSEWKTGSVPHHVLGITTDSTDFVPSATPSGTDVALVDFAESDPNAPVLFAPYEGSVGACSPPLQLKIASANPPWARVLSVQGVEAETYADPDCATPTSSVPIAPGFDLGIVFVKPTGLAAEVRVRTMFGAEKGATTFPGLALLTFASPPLPQSPPLTLLDNQCGSLGDVLTYPASRLSVFDASGTQRGSGLAYGGPSCNQGLGNDPAGFASFRAPPGAYLLQVAGGGLSTSTALVTVIGGAVPDRLALGPTSRHLVTVGCSAAQYVMSVDALGVPQNLGTALTVALEGTGLTAFSDARCGTPTTSITIPPQAAHSESFYVRADVVGHPTLRLSAPALIGTLESYDAVPGAVRRASLQGAQTVAIDGCDRFDLQTFDEFANPSAEDRDPSPFNLSASGVGAVDWFSDAKCRSPITAHALPPGMWWGPLWVSGRRAGAVTLSAQSGHLPASTTVVVGASVTGPTTLEFTASPLSLTLATCSPAFTVRPLDAQGLPVDEPGDLALVSSDALTTFFADDTCTTPLTSLAGPTPSTGRTFHVRAQTPGPVLITVSHAPRSVTIHVQAIAGPPASLVVSPTTVSVPRDGCAPVSARLLDAHGFDASGAVLVDSSGAVPLSFGAGVCGAAPSLTLTFTGGGAQSVALRGANIGAGIARFNSGSLSPVNVPVTLTAPAVAAWRFSPATPLQAEAGACTPLLVQALDATGRTTATTNAAALGAPPNLTFHLDAACSGAAVTSVQPVPEAGATVYVRGTLVQSSTMTVGSAPQAASRRALSVFASAPAVVHAPATLAFTGRTCASLGPLTLADRFGNAVSTFAAGLTVSSTGAQPLLVSRAADCTTAQPTTLLAGAFPNSTLWVTGLTHGTGQLTIAGTQVGSGLPPTTVSVSVDWPAPVGLAFEPSPAQPVALVAGACTSARVFAFDDGGVATQVSASQRLSASRPSGELRLGTTCTGALATAVGPVGELGEDLAFRDTRVGTTVMTVGVGAFSTSLSFSIDAGAPSQLRMDPVTLTAKDCDLTGRARFEDAFGNAADSTWSVDLATTGDRGLRVSASGDCALAQATATLAFTGQPSLPVALEALRAGTATLDLTAPGLGQTRVVPITINEGRNDAPVVSVTPPTLYLDESDAGLVVVTASDIDWDPLSWAWTQTSGPSEALAFLGPSQLGGDFLGQAVFRAPRVTHDTTFEWSVLVKDDHGHLLDSGVRFVVRDSINELPTAVARARGASSVESGTVVQVTGEDSSDPNGELLTYAWTLDASVPLAQPTAVRPSVTAPPVGPGGGVLRFGLTVSDPRGGVSDEATLEISVTATEVPRITSLPRTFARVARAYEYDDDLTATALAPLAGGVTWSLVTAPPGFTITADGLVAWTPSRVADEEVVLRATSALGWSEQRFVVRVQAAPVITSTPSLSAALLRPWAYDDDARPTAIGAEPIGWRLERAPTGMVIDQLTGAVTWTPLVAGLHQVVIVAQNAFGEDRQDFLVAVGDGSVVTIADTANRRAQKGIGYVYDGDQRVDVTPAGSPVRALNAPEGFVVSSSGLVSWIPTEAGDFEVTLAAGAPVAATFRYTVTVEEPSNDVPLAVGVARPATANDAPLVSQLDGTGSTAAAGRALVLWSWEAGDGTPPRYAASVPATYAQPGGYSPRLEVADDRGTRASTSVSVAVGLDGVFPPGGVLQVLSREDLGDGSVSVRFGCQCSDPASRPLALRWSFGDGATSYDPEPTHVYTSASRFRVRLEISNGLLTTTLLEEVEVRSGNLRPPAVRAWAEPVIGAAPLQVKFTSAAADFDGVIATRQWDFGDGATAIADEAQRRFETPGTYDVVFRASDDDGLSSQDSVRIVVTDGAGLAPPVFVSAPATHVATLGTPWKYDEDGRLAARGATRYGVGRVRAGQTLGAPDGIRVDGATGLVTWTPKSPGAWPIFFWAENEAGRVWQDDVIVDVPAPATGCGCSALETTPMLLWGLLLWSRRRQRPAGARHR